MKQRSHGAIPPAPGGESFGLEELGEPVYKVRLLPGGGVAKLNPGDDPLPAEMRGPIAPKHPAPKPATPPPAAPLPPA